MSPKYRDNCELISLGSVSKGLLGEGGIRGGYMYLHNINPEVIWQMGKLQAIQSEPNLIGQAMMEIAANPPLGSNIQQSTKDQYIKEINSLYESLKWRVKMMNQVLGRMENISCQ